LAEFVGIFDLMKKISEKVRNFAKFYGILRKVKKLTSTMKN